MAGINLNKQDRYIAKWARKIRKALQEQVDPALVLTDYVNLKPDRLQTMIKEDPVRDAFIGLYGDVGSVFARDILKQLVKQEQVDPYLQEMRRYATIEAGQRIQWITEETRSLIFDAVRAAIDKYTGQGLGISKTTDLIQKELKKRIGRIERWRAMRIAATETATASNRAAQLSAEQLDIPTVKSWRTAHRKPRDTHRAAENDPRNKNIDTKSDFVVNGYFAKQPLAPTLPAGEVVNCHCWVDYKPAI